MLNEIRWPNESDPVSDETLESPFKDHEADGFGHKVYEDFIVDHLRSDDPHNINRLKNNLLEKHLNNEFAHQKLFTKYFNKELEKHLDSDNSHRIIVENLLRMLSILIISHTHDFFEKMNEIKNVSSLPESGKQGEFIHKDGYFYLWFNNKWHKYKLKLKSNNDIRKFFFFFDEYF
ncbi:MAG: hypothetical protein QXX30_02230 [Candidatus Aenigmatarchaeota archaeon]